MTTAQPTPPTPSSPYGQPNPYAQPVAEPRALSITSMVCGIAGLVFPFFLVSLAAVIFGHIARKKEPASSGMSLAGLITGYIGLGLSVVVIGLILVFSIILPLVVIGSMGASGYYS